MIAVNPHSAIAMVAVKWAAGGIDRDQMMLNAEPITLGIAVRKESSLQHLIGRKPDAGNYVGWVEGRLFHLGKVVFRVSVQFQDTHLYQGIILVEPDLGEVKRVVGTFCSIFLRHHLDKHGPGPQDATGHAPEV